MKIKNMSNRKILIIILLLSATTHFIFFGYPKETVFDEVHFGKFISAYYTGEFYFDIHPPLGKLIIAGFAKLFNFKPDFNFAQIGEKFPDKKYLVLRLLPNLAGTLLPIIIFLLSLEIGLSRLAAFCASFFIIFDNALLVQSRFILMDSFLLLFGFSSLLFYLKYRKKEDLSLISEKKKIINWNLFWMALFGGMAVSIKWTGLSFIALPLLIESIHQFKKNKIANKSLKKLFGQILKFTKFSSYFLISIIIYFSIFLLHFSLLPKAGSGDVFMKPDFRNNNIVKNIINLNSEMYRANKNLTGTHPYSSRWYQWPFGSKPIFYWVNNNSKIFLQSNPVVWLGSTISLIIAILLILLQKFKLNIGSLKSHNEFLFLKNKNNNHHNLDTLYLLFAGYFLNLLPFISIKRVMFLYHYFVALIFAIMIMAYLIDLIDQNKNRQKTFVGLLISATIVFFFYFASITYGL